MSSKLTKITGASLIFTGVYLNIPFSILNAIFEYPQILRQPAGEVLTLFRHGGATLIAVWYAFAFAPILLIVVAKLVQKIFEGEHETLLSIAATFGVLAGITQVLGLIRWVFVVPMLADNYTNPNSSEATKDAAVMVFNALHQYAGVALGEHLGQLFTALWVLLISSAMLDSKVFRKWQGKIGIFVGILMLAGLTEGFATVINFDPGVFGLLTPLSFITLSFWMISLGSTLIWSKTDQRFAFREAAVYEI